MNHAWNRCTKAAAAREWGTDSLQTLPDARQHAFVARL
jgi:hypothetical protein